MTTTTITPSNTTVAGEVGDFVSFIYNELFIMPSDPRKRMSWAFYKKVMMDQARANVAANESLSAPDVICDSMFEAANSFGLLSKGI